MIIYLSTFYKLSDMIDILYWKIMLTNYKWSFFKWLQAKIFKKRIKLPSSIIFTFISSGVALSLPLYLSFLTYVICIFLTFSRSVSSNSLSFRIIFHSREWHLCLVKACCACMFVDYFSTSFFIQSFYAHEHLNAIIYCTSLCCTSTY